MTGTTTNLSVLGADDGGEANLTYTWTTTGNPPAVVTFGANGTNASKSTTATFAKAGSYSFQVTIKDAGRSDRRIECHRDGQCDVDDYCGQSAFRRCSSEWHTSL